MTAADEKSSIHVPLLETKGSDLESCLDLSSASLTPPTDDERHHHHHHGHHHHQHESLEDSITFIERVQKGIYVLGFELGFLVQASTVNIQYMTTFVFDRTSQLILSFLWSYLVSLMALMVFFLCQKAVYAFMHEVVGPLGAAKDNHRQKPDQQHQHQEQQPNNQQQQPQQHPYQFLLEDWKVELKCQFIQGSLLGVFCSWVFMDCIMNFRIRVIYGGILFLVSLLLFMAQMYCRLPLCEQHNNNNSPQKDNKAQQQQPETEESIYMYFYVARQLWGQQQQQQHPTRVVASSS